MYRLKGSPSFLNRKTMVQSPLMSAQGYSAQSRCPIISSATLNPDPLKENKTVPISSNFHITSHFFIP